MVTNIHFRVLGDGAGLGHSPDGGGYWWTVVIELADADHKRWCTVWGLQLVGHLLAADPDRWCGGKGWAVSNKGCRKRRRRGGGGGGRRRGVSQARPGTRQVCQAGIDARSHILMEDSCLGRKGKLTSQRLG